MIMESQSGFFQSPANDIEESSILLEPIHISENGFAVLYKCNKRGQVRIYKGLRNNLIGNPLYESLLKKEFEIGSSMSHPGIREYYSFEEIPGLGRCIEMEWIEGKNLSQRIEEGSLDSKVARKVLLEICDTLSYIHHKQVIHRDLKPENIMITDNGNNAKIIDFGLSDADTYVIGKTPAGTREYASPELLRGEETDCRSDIFSLGKIISLLPLKLSAIVEKATKDNKEERYASDEEVKQAVLKSGRSVIWPIIAGFVLLVILAIVTVKSLSYIGEKNFSKDFYSFLLKNFDKDKNGKLSKKEVASVTEMTAVREGFTSVRGLERFKNMRKCNLAINSLENIDISKNQNLVWLELNENPLKSLDISKNPNLIHLSAGGCYLKSLDVSKNLALRDLHLQDNQLTEIDVSMLPMLRSLYVSLNELEELDLSNNPYVNELHCQLNPRLKVVYVKKGHDIAMLQKDGHTIIKYK